MISLLDLIALLFGVRVYCLLIDNGNWRSEDVNGCKAPSFSWFLAHGKQNSLSHSQAWTINIYFLCIHVWWSSGVCGPWKIRPHSLYPHLGIHTNDISFQIWNHKRRIPTNSHHSSSDTRSEAMVDTAPHNHFESGLVPWPPPQGCSVSSRDGRQRCPLVSWGLHQDSRGRTTYPVTKPGSSWHLLCPIWSHHILIKESTRFFPVYITSDLPCYWVAKKAIS